MELQEKKREEQRDALQIDLEWTNPLRDAHMQAFMASEGHVRGDIDELQFREKYPKAIKSDLARFGLPIGASRFPEVGHRRKDAPKRNAVRCEKC